MHARTRGTYRAFPVLAQVLPTQLIPDEKEGKILRVRMIQKEANKSFDSVYLFDDGSTVSWIPCGRKLTCSYPGEWQAALPCLHLAHDVTTAAGSCWPLGKLIAAAQCRQRPVRSPFRLSATPHLHQCVEGLVNHGHEDAVHNEPRPVRRHAGDFAQVLNQGLGQLERLQPHPSHERFMPL